MSMRRLLVVQQEVAENTHHEDAGFTESHGTNEINNARSTSRLAAVGRVPRIARQEHTLRVSSLAG
jgi:hypothetical protein